MNLKNFSEEFEKSVCDFSVEVAGLMVKKQIFFAVGDKSFISKSFFSLHTVNPIIYICMDFKILLVEFLLQNLPNVPAHLNFFGQCVFTILRLRNNVQETLGRVGRLVHPICSTQLKFLVPRVKRVYLVTPFTRFFSVCLENLADHNLEHFLFGNSNCISIFENSKRFWQKFSREMFAMR